MANNTSYFVDYFVPIRDFDTVTRTHPVVHIRLHCDSTPSINTSVTQRLLAWFGRTLPIALGDGNAYIPIIGGPQSRIRDIMTIASTTQVRTSELFTLPEPIIYDPTPQTDFDPFVTKLLIA